MSSFFGADDATTCPQPAAPTTGRVTGLAALVAVRIPLCDGHATRRLRGWFHDGTRNDFLTRVSGPLFRFLRGGRRLLPTAAPGTALIAG